MVHPIAILNQIIVKHRSIDKYVVPQFFGNFSILNKFNIDINCLGPVGSYSLNYRYCNVYLVTERKEAHPARVVP